MREDSSLIPLGKWCIAYKYCFVISNMCKTKKKSQKRVRDSLVEAFNLLANTLWQGPVLHGDSKAKQKREKERKCVRENKVCERYVCTMNVKNIGHIFHNHFKCKLI